MFELLRAIWNAAEVELIHLRAVLISILSATVLGVVLILVFRPSVGVCFWITLLPWLFSLYHLFSVGQLIRVHLAGESFEFLTALAKIGKKTDADGKKPTGPFSNEITDMYLAVIKGLALAQTGLFLLLPLYVNFTEGGITMGIMYSMLAVALAIVSLEYLKKVGVWLIGGVVVLYVIGSLFVFFPQIGFYLSGVTGKVQVVAPSTAKLSNDLDALRRKQQEKIDNDFVKGVIAWQEKHPGQELPPKYQAAFARARQLGKLKK